MRIKVSKTTLLCVFAIVPLIAGSFFLGKFHGVANSPNSAIPSGIDENSLYINELECDVLGVPLNKNGFQGVASKDSGRVTEVADNYENVDDLITVRKDLVRDLIGMTNIVPREYVNEYVIEHAITLYERDLNIDESLSFQDQIRVEIEDEKIGKADSLDNKVYLHFFSNDPSVNGVVLKLTDFEGKKTIKRYPINPEQTEHYIWFLKSSLVKGRYKVEIYAANQSLVLLSGGYMTIT